MCDVCQFASCVESAMSYLKSGMRPSLALAAVKGSLQASVAHMVVRLSGCSSASVPQECSDHVGD